MSLKDFSIEYLMDKSCVGVSVLDSDFHDKVAEKFPKLKRELKMWGCQPVPAAMKALKELYKDYRISRGRIGLGANWQPGFPKWVYTYSIKKEYRI